MAKKLYGTDPDQVPTNADLGTMAYQDAERPALGQTTVKSAGTALIVERTGDATNLQFKADGQNVGHIYGFKNGAGGNLAFYPTNSVGTITQRMIINRDGNVTINDGNLVLANGHGIDFSATGDGSGTTTSELLDDYEEGTWTPVISTGTVTYTAQRGRYTKIGRTVHIHGFIQIATISGSSGTDIVSGLPFTSKNDINYTALASKTNGYDWGGSSTMITFQVVPNTTKISAVGSGNNQAFRDVNSSGLSAGDWIAFSGHYVTDA